jgi:hypothetical protein
VLLTLNLNIRILQEVCKIFPLIYMYMPPDYDLNNLPRSIILYRHWLLELSFIEFFLIQTVWIVGEMCFPPFGKNLFHVLTFISVYLIFHIS